MGGDISRLSESAVGQLCAQRAKGGPNERWNGHRHTSQENSNRSSVGPYKRMRREEQS